MAKKQLDLSKGLRYVGNGNFIVGVPARDLTPDEATKHWERIEAAASAGSDLYAEPVTTTAPKPAQVKED